jgi:hypothetical protein
MNPQSDHRAAEIKGAPPPSPPLPFTLVASPADFRDPAAIIVRIPPGIRSKQKLFAVLAKKLRFPPYFGWNWDALEECLGDLSWLPAERTIAIVHEDLPFGPGGENRAIYLDLLRNVAINLPKSSHRRLLVVWPASTDEMLSAAASRPR